WGDNRSDEDQLGATYSELEWAMQNSHSDRTAFSLRQREVMEIYTRLNKVNQHKILPIPVCEIPEDFK
ncbi:MAG: NAD(+) synthetase, partial [Flavobacteriales bacterium]|nr:NAD(+) synthetase [Flavobacteriales bacterium]